MSPIAASEQVAVVTGGARGIGFGITHALLNAGYRVAMFDLNRDALDEAVEKLGHPPSLAALQVDVTNSDSVKSGFATINDRWKAPDILVNNAGISRDKRVVRMTEEDWDFVIETNLRSQFLCVKEAIPAMLAKKYGRIVNISSRAWLGGFGQANYSAAKGGVISFTRSLAIELASDGITANAIAPGIIETPLLNSYSEEVRARLRRSVPAERIGLPQDVAHAVLMFVDGNASYITGQTLYVCGGRSLSSPNV